MSVLMVEETGVPRGNHQPVAGHCQCYWWRKPVYPEKTTNLSQVTLSFNGGGNRCTQRKPSTCCRSLSVLMVEEIGVPRENHQPVAGHFQF